MSCCGHKRSQFYAGAPRRPAVAQAAQGPRPPNRASSQRSAVFEYVGATGLSVIGPVTRTLYRFDARGTQVVVDPRDALAIARVPNVRQVR
jgi:hypothetical protein